MPGEIREKIFACNVEWKICWGIYMAAPMSFLHLKIENDESSCSSILFVFQLIQLSKNQSIHFVPENWKNNLHLFIFSFFRIIRRTIWKKLHFKLIIYSFFCNNYLLVSGQTICLSKLLRLIRNSTNS